MPTQRYLIIGFGVYGISTADHLDPSDPLTILSYHQRHAPSHDVAKIIRTDYDNIQRMKEAICAQRLWTDDERFKPFYHPVGRIVAYDKAAISILNGIDKARSQLGKERRIRYDRAILEEFYGTTNALDDLTFVFNEDDGIVEWAGCMRGRKEAIEKRCRENEGSNILDARVETLMHEGRRITAVVLANGESIETGDTKVTLAAGPWIVELLDKSGIEQPPDWRMPIATGLFAFTLQLSEDQVTFFKGKPSFSHVGHGILPQILQYHRLMVRSGVPASY
jgi:glycine/D-amino acid oxidase-like deaminating enzyme